MDRRGWESLELERVPVYIRLGSLSSCWGADLLFSHVLARNAAAIDSIVIDHK